MPTTPRRRDLAALVPALAAAAQAQSTGGALPTRVFHFDDLPRRANGQNGSRAVLNGKNRSGFAIEMHHTELAPGLAAHAPHSHVHEEVLLLREGKLEVTIAGKATALGPGDLAYIASGEHHGWRNIGDTRAHYLVITLGREG